MDAKNIQKLVEKAKNDILKEVNDRLPRKVGVIAVNHFKQNFRDGGWLDDGLHPWKKTIRQKQGGRDAKYGPLTSRRNHMMRSIQSSLGVGEVTIENPTLPYTMMVATSPHILQCRQKYTTYCHAFAASAPSVFL